MKIEIEKLTDEYELKIEYNNRIEICYIKNIKKLLEYLLINVLYILNDKSEFFSRSYAKVNIEYEKEE